MFLNLDVCGVINLMEQSLSDVFPENIQRDFT